MVLSPEVVDTIIQGGLTSITLYALYTMRGQQRDFTKSLDDFKGVLANHMEHELKVREKTVRILTRLTDTLDGDKKDRNSKRGK